MTPEATITPGLREQSQLQAGHALVTRLLNCYLREQELQDVVFSAEQRGWASLAAERRGKPPAQPLIIPLLNSDTWLLAEVRAYSPIGQHQWGEQLWLGAHGMREPRPVRSALDLAQLLVEDLAAGASCQEHGAFQRLLGAVANSLTNTERYVERVLQQGRPQRMLAATQASILAEQSLIFGHPFHPMPKSSHGFTHADLERCFLKLPLNVRITNFLRNNRPDQLRRSLDASMILGSLPAPTPHCTILSELGYRMLAPDACQEAERAAIMAATGVLFRQGPRAASAPPMVLASLLEPCPHTFEPPVLQALRQVEQGPRVSADTACRWLRRYLDIVIAPILGYFLRYGVSLEAHVQNTMLALEGGWPSHVYVRDLEGVSISRSMAARFSWCDGTLPANSPALYPEAQAWQRWQWNSAALPVSWATLLQLRANQAFSRACAAGCAG